MFRNSNTVLVCKKEKKEKNLQVAGELITTLYSGWHNKAFNPCCWALMTMMEMCVVCWRCELRWAAASKKAKAWSQKREHKTGTITTTNSLCRAPCRLNGTTFKWGCVPCCLLWQCSSLTTKTPPVPVCHPMALAHPFTPVTASLCQALQRCESPSLVIIAHCQLIISPGAAWATTGSRTERQYVDVTLLLQRQ